MNGAKLKLLILRGLLILYNLLTIAIPLLERTGAALEEMVKQLHWLTEQAKKAQTTLRGIIGGFLGPH